MNMRMVACGLAIVSIAYSIEVGAAESPAPATAPAAVEKADPKALVLELQKDVAALRGLPFKTDVAAAVQSQEDFAAYLDERIDETVPEVLNTHYGAIVKRLGLYRGTLDNFGDTAKAVMSSQAAAYYDPEKQTFYMLMQDMPELMTRMLYSHELYHGLQEHHEHVHGEKHGPPAADA